jgi:hypothetical protein
MTEYRKQFEEQGFCVIPRIVYSLHAALYSVRDGWQWTKSGPALLLTSEQVREALAGIGFTDIRLSFYRMETRFAGEPAVTWSQTYRPWVEVETLYFAQRTGPEQGGMRVVPGSHLAPASPAAGTTGHLDGEVDLQLGTGEMLVMHPSLLRAMHPNASLDPMSWAKVCYVPGWSALPAEHQEAVAAEFPPVPAGWWTEYLRWGHRLRPLVPAYTGPDELPPLDDGPIKGRPNFY